MKFGLYRLPTMSDKRMIRIIDGEISVIWYNPSSADPGKCWEYVLAAPARPCRVDVIKSMLENSGILSTYCRSVAQAFYGVPDDVELYEYGDFGVEKEIAAIKAANGSDQQERSHFNILRSLTGLNLKDFADSFGFPYRTAQNWDSNTAKCPDYLLELIAYKMDKEGMVKHDIK